MSSSTCASPPLHTPRIDIAELTDQLGRAWAVSGGESLPQYLAWSEAAGMFDVLARCTSASLEELCEKTVLNECGVAALVPILTSLKLLRRGRNGRYQLSDLAWEYLINTRPYYIGEGLYWDCQKPLPETYLKSQPSGGNGSRAPVGWPATLRLRMPHSRNFAPSVVAARSGEFDRLTHVVDVGGGSGVFAIPLALDHPGIRVTLLELPAVTDLVRANLASYGVEQRVEVLGIDVFKDEWRVGSCDGIFFGNIFHGTNDARCECLARKSFEAMQPGGKVWVHEVLFNDNKDGPLLAALWNANVIARNPDARQRTAKEIISILEKAGFQDCYIVPTAGRFSLVAGCKTP